MPKLDIQPETTLAKRVSNLTSSTRHPNETIFIQILYTEIGQSKSKCRSYIKVTSFLN